MPFTDIYRQQVALLVQTLPHIAEETCFALKGGTAINLFVRDMPRLSVDIDLTYLPIADREHSLAEIEAALKRIGDRIKKLRPSYTITESIPIIKEKLDRLEEATLRNPNIPEKAKQIMEGNRSSFVKQHNIFLDSLEVPDDVSYYKTNEFCDSFAEKIEHLAQTCSRNTMVLNEFFKNEAGAVSKGMK